MRYIKQTPRITVKFINADTEEVLFEIKDRSWMNLGEIYPDYTITQLMEQQLAAKNIKKAPKNILVLAVGEYSLE